MKAAIGLTAAAAVLGPATLAAATRGWWWAALSIAALTIALFVVAGRRGRPTWTPLTVGFLVGLTVFAAWLSPHGPMAAAAPGGVHPLGTDHLGRDILARLMLGNRTSVLIAAAAAGLSSVLGVAFGALLSLLPPRFRFAGDVPLQVFLSLPVLLFYLIGLALFPAGPNTLILLMGFTLWPELARLVQERLESLRQAPFVVAAHARGDGAVQVFRRELLPNLTGLVATYLLLNFISAILLESILSYLGLGLPLGTPSLGALLHECAGLFEHRMAPLAAVFGLLTAYVGGLRLAIRSLQRRTVPHLAVS